MNDILFLMVDQLSAKWLELGLEGVCSLPNINRLKCQGTYFDHAYTNNPVCCPARATIATGLSSRSHGVIENGYYLDSSAPTFMKVLQKAGYRTGVFGKLHFMPHFSGFDYDARAYGFDVAHVTEDNRGGEWLDWALETFPEHTDQILKSIPTPRVEAFKTYGKEKKNLQVQIDRLRKESWATEQEPEATDWAHCLTFPEEVSQTAWITENALDFIKETPKDQPLFAHISYVGPHNPYEVPKRYMKQVDVEKIPERIPATWKNDPDAPEYFKDKIPLDRENWKYERQVYLASLVFIDSYIGKILDTMEKERGFEDTYIFFVSDHGDMLGDHGFYLKEEKHYDTCIRVPYFVCGPKILKNTRNHEIVQPEDICPTILEMAGMSMEVPPYAEIFMKINPKEIPLYHGTSMKELLEGKKVEWRTAGYCESYNPVFSMKPTDWARTVVTNKYRYTYYFHGGEQLFDLEKDPNELCNVAKKEEYQNVKRELKDILLEKIIAQDYPKPLRQLYCIGVH